jgi:hypothetical protein
MDISLSIILIERERIKVYQKICDDFISGVIDVGLNRRDLKGEDGSSKAESITQIMVPSKHYPALLIPSIIEK